MNLTVLFHEGNRDKKEYPGLIEREFTALHNPFRTNEKLGMLGKSCE